MDMGEARQLVREVLDEQEARFERNETASMQRAVRATLTALGVIISPEASEDEVQAQLFKFRKNMEHADKWRRSVEQVERIGWGTAITVLVTGVLGVIWMGFKILVGKG